MLPYKEALTRFDDSSYIYFGGDFTTGGLALTYTLADKRLRILGAPLSVFSADLPDPLKTAREHYLARRWDPCDQALAQIQPDRLANDLQRRWLEQLRSARDRTRQSTELLLLEILCNLQEGDAYRASMQFRALQRCLGPTADPRLAALEARFAEGNTAWFVREGQQFYQHWTDMLVFTVKSWVPPGQVAKRMLDGLPSPRPPFWQPLSPTSELDPQPWRSLVLPPGQSPPDGWERPDFDDRGWIDARGIATRLSHPDHKDLPNGPVAARRRFHIDHPARGTLRVRVRTVRPTNTRVYLNGTPIAHLERGQRGGYAAIRLDDRATALLRPGHNLLAITSDQQGGGANALDVGLDIHCDGAEPRHQPIDRCTTLRSADLPATDTALHVADTTERYRDTLRKAYLDKPVDALLRDLGTIIAYDRSMAEDALVAKGLEAIEAATTLRGHPDWKVRAGVVGVIRKAHRRYTTDKDQAGLAFVAAQLPALTAIADDPHFWARTLACETLGDLGPAASHAVPALLKASGDGHEWVRQSALAALQKLAADPATLFSAVDQAARQDNTAFNVASAALLVARGPEAATDAQRLDLLARILRHPPQGGGGKTLADMIDIACALDPEGAVMIPLLIDAAADKTGLSRQRGNPRGKAIEALGTYGPRAAAAVDTLQALAAEDSAKARPWSQAAAEALSKINRSLEHPAPTIPTPGTRPPPPGPGSP